MGNILNKPAVLNRIKEYYSLKGNADLARFLGVAPNTITNWYGRSTFDVDVIYTKCEGISFDWLFTGNGSMLIPDRANTQTSQPADESLLYTMYKEKDEEVKVQAEQIGALKQTIRQLEEKIAGLQQNIHPDMDFDTSKVSGGSTRTHGSGVAGSESAPFAEQP